MLCTLMWTDAEAKHFYNSVRWKRKRIEILRRDAYQCVICKQRLEDANAKGEELPPTQRRIRKAYTVHHIKELKEFPELGLDNDNLISICHECHDKIHGRTADTLKPYWFKSQTPKREITKEMW